MLAQGLGLAARLQRFMASSGQRTAGGRAVPEAGGSTFGVGRKGMAASCICAPPLRMSAVCAAYKRARWLCFADGHIETESKSSVPYLYVGVLDDEDYGRQPETLKAKRRLSDQPGGADALAVAGMRQAATTFMTDDKPRCQTLQSHRAMPIKGSLSPPS